MSIRFFCQPVLRINRDALEMQKDDPAILTRQWIETFVVGLQLCPFAKPVLSDNTLAINVTAATTQDEILGAVLKQLDSLQASSEQEVSTSLLIFEMSLHDFDEYLDAAAMAEDLLAEAGLEGIIQIATFHPRYCFEGVDESDLSNYSNRSPYPMLHFIRESQLTRSLASYPHPEQIPLQNIRKLREMGETELFKLLGRFRVK